MADLTARAYRPDDAAALAGLFNAVEKAAGAHPGFTADAIGSMVAAMIRQPDTDSRLLVAADGTVAAAGLVTTPPPGGFRVDLMGGVHPAWRGRGIGRDLLAWQLARAAEIHREVAPEADWQAEAGAFCADLTAVRLLERAGLRPARYFFDMRAGTADAPPAVVPDGVRTGPYDAGLARELHAAHMEAFEDHWGYQRRDFAPWATMTVRSAGFRPELSRLAFDGDEIVGYLLSYDSADAERVYVGQVGTRRQWRRRGVAGALLAEALAAAARAGRKYLTLGVDADSPTGAVGVYERVGFAVEHRAVSYRRPLRG